MLTRCVPPIPLVTPFGSGMAEFVIDYGPDWHLLWVVFIDATGECRTVQNPDIRLQRNETLDTQSSHRTIKGLSHVPGVAAKSQ
jgi:hypothetical protein